MRPTHTISVLTSLVRKCLGDMGRGDVCTSGGDAAPQQQAAYLWDARASCSVMAASERDGNVLLVYLLLISKLYTYYRGVYKSDCGESVGVQRARNVRVST